MLHKSVLEQLQLFLQRFISENTQQSYKRDIVQFIQFLEEQTQTPVSSALAITERMLVVWKQTLIQKKLLPTTQNRKLSAVSSFIDYVHNHQHTASPTEHLKRPKSSYISKTQILTEDEVTQMMAYLEQKCQQARKKKGIWASYKEEVQETLLYVLLATGLRVSEGCALRWQDVSLAPPHDANATSYLHIPLAKGQSSYTIPVSEKTTQRLQALKAYHPQPLSNETPVFCLHLHHPMPVHRSTVFRVLKKVALACGWQKRISPHSLRATLATILHKKGVGVAHIQSYLNHKNIRTTALYIKQGETLSAPLSLDFNPKETLS